MAHAPKHEALQAAWDGEAFVFPRPSSDDPGSFAHPCFSSFSCLYLPSKSYEYCLHLHQPSVLPRVNQSSRRVESEWISHRIKLSVIVLTVTLAQPKKRSSVEECLDQFGLWGNL